MFSSQLGRVSRPPRIPSLQDVVKVLLPSTPCQDRRLATPTPLPTSAPTSAPDRRVPIWSQCDGNRRIAIDLGKIGIASRPRSITRLSHNRTTRS